MPPHNEGEMGQGSGASAPQGSHATRNVIIGTVSVIVLVVALIAGVQVARSNTDWICRKVVDVNGECTNGSWGPWSAVSQSSDQAACTTTTAERRVYTGTRLTQMTLQYSNLRTNCAEGFTQTAIGNQNGASGYENGSVTSAYAACQIEQTRMVVRNGTGSGASCELPSNTSTSTTVVNQNQTITTSGETTSETSGNLSAQEFWGRYASLATSSIAVVPSLVRSGDTTRVQWATQFVNSCAVQGTNGDQWTGTASPDGGELSAPIIGQTTYTLSCTTAIGTVLTSQATVNLLPVFNER